MKYIASGTYGCIFTPPFKCINNSVKDEDINKGMISKVFNNTNDYNTEKHRQNIVDNVIDPLHEFTRPVIRQCDAFINSSKSDVEACKHISAFKNTYKQLIFKEGGEDLGNILKYYQKNNSLAHQLLHAFIPIVKGLKNIYHAGYSHLDIKPHNILFDAKTNKMILIDFGLMTTFTNIYKTKYIVHADYPYYPPEFKMFSCKQCKKDLNIFTNMFLSNFENNIIINKKSYNLYLEMAKTLDYSIEEQRDDIIMLSKLKNPLAYTNKIDIYSLGIVFLIMYLWNARAFEKYKGFKKIIKSMICFNPRARISHVPLVSNFLLLF